ncbi:MAG: hypothetical protein WC812_02000 [Candidatus Pacearchaeota archaeon]|jgi:hypothetical protein
MLNESSSWMILILLIILVVLVCQRYVRKKVRNEKGIINKNLHNYNMLLSVAIGLQVAFILEVFNIIRKFLMEGNIYKVDIVIILLLGVLWISQDIFLNSKFVKK